MNEDRTPLENREIDGRGNDPETNGNDTDGEGELPESAVEEAERLTRLAHDAVDERERAAYEDEREDLLAEHGFTARVRREDGDRVLVCHPEEWVAGGSVRPDRIEDLDRAVEVPLSGAGDPDDWAAVDEHNREVAARIRAEYGDVHGDNAEAFADFMGNHYAKPVERATAGELREFIEEYFPRNAWPTDEQRAAVGRSVELVFEVTDEPVPEI